MAKKIVFPKFKAPKIDKKEIEEIKVAGGKVIETVKKILHEGNIRRLYIRHKGETILEIPVTFAAAGIFLAPILAAIGAVSALVTECSIGIERSSSK